MSQSRPEDDTTITFAPISLSNRKTKRQMHIASGAVRLAHRDTLIMIEEGVVTIGKTDGIEDNISISIADLYKAARVIKIVRN